MKVENIFDSKATFNAPHSAGIYFLRFQSTEGMTTTKLIVLD
jgi:hypothetical protein